MKKILLSVLGMIAIYSTSATQYMHINLPNGNVYDVKVEKTDYVSHINKDGKDFIKVTLVQTAPTRFILLKEQW